MPRPLTPRALRLLAFAALLAFAPLPAAAQTPDITRATLISPGLVSISFASDPAADFVLLRGDTVLEITQAVMTNRGVAGPGQFIYALPDPARPSFFRRRRDGLTTLTEISPAHGESGVSVNRETIFRLSAPLAADTMLSTSNFFAQVGGRKILSRVELASDRRSATLFYLEPIPGSTRIYARFDAAGVRDEAGREVDADGDGQSGGARALAFDTYSTTPIPGTAVIGRVFASELVPGHGAGATNRPLPGVTITVDGREQDIRAVTDADGRFVLTNCPAGRFFVHIDGRTSPLSQWPGGAYYPFVGKAWEAIPGLTNNLAGCEWGLTNCDGHIYLPLIPADTLQPVSAAADTLIIFPPAVVAANPALAGVSITVPANALFNEAGTRGGSVGIAPVPPDRLPGLLPPGLEFPLVITVQTSGPENFDRPVPVRFPNLPDPITGEVLPAGAKSALWSFNHDTGVWEIQGPMTVTADGRFVESDPGAKRNAAAGRIRAR